MKLVIFFNNKNVYYLISLFFLLLEVYLYNDNNSIQLFLSIVEYLFIFVLLLFDYKTSIIYFISFSLLSFGSWTYVIDEILPANFWGLRIFGVSVNFISTILIFLYIIFKDKKISITGLHKENYFLISFYLYSATCGLIYYFLGYNYFDNLVKDLSIYFPIFLYTLILTKIDEESSLFIFKNCITVTIISMLFALILGRYFEYGSGLKFILINSFGYLVIFIIPFCSKLYSNVTFKILLFICLILLLSGKMFIGGKFIINIFITLIWYFLFFKRKFFVTFTFIFTIFIISLYWTPVTDFLMNYFSSNLLVQNKLSQVISVVNILDLDLLSSSPTSIGNIIAEGRSILSFFVNSSFVSFTGLGFGGGIPDVYGYLAP